MENVIKFGLIAAVAIFIGSLIPLLYKLQTPRGLHRLMAFGSGVLLSAAFLHIIPEAMELDKNTSTIGILIAFLLIFVIEHYTIVHSCPEPEKECPVHIMGMVAYLALSFHSLLDGVVLAGAFAASVSLGLIAACAIIIHKLPAGISTSSILIASEYNKKKIILMCLFLSLATPLGAILSFLLMVNIPNQILAIILGISAGSFVYIGAADILPRLHKERDLWCLFLLTAGIVIMDISRYISIGDMF